jgi:hypothetical protein
MSRSGKIKSSGFRSFLFFLWDDGGYFFQASAARRIRLNALRATQILTPGRSAARSPESGLCNPDKRKTCGAAPYATREIHIFFLIYS